MPGAPTFSPAERQTLGALRDAVNDEAAGYVAIMRLFTGGISGFLSDQSAAEVAECLAEQGLDIAPDTVDARLSIGRPDGAVDHGLIAPRPR